MKSPQRDGLKRYRWETEGWGAMVFGGVDDELLQLNESSLWSGGPVLHHVNDQAPFYLALCRNALLKNEFDSAEYYAKKMQGCIRKVIFPWPILPSTSLLKITIL